MFNEVYIIDPIVSTGYYTWKLSYHHGIISLHYDIQILVIPREPRKHNYSVLQSEVPLPKMFYNFYVSYISLLNSLIYYSLRMGNLLQKKNHQGSQ